MEQPPREVVGAPGLSVFGRHLDNVLNNMLLASPRLVRHLDWMVVASPFQLKQSVLFYSNDIFNSLTKILSFFF